MGVAQAGDLITKPALLGLERQRKLRLQYPQLLGAEEVNPVRAIEELPGEVETLLKQSSMFKHCSCCEPIA
ncbi:unnamed protein product [Vitrella brassicaformis CCMP3155]|uniref:Uncharacterized protein n=1 Tax=Vitrella brassicaformis (strain CCMP3155) TaxID=1169540 RepID=A0A0G4ERA6_VITBC|nr:unnamed protein product [Vitrella brassicaformis CCMP3155]|eukprot:CEM00549.1 unnamed protein product [Vitrella brassicaformis CCMP3155]